MAPISPQACSPIRLNHIRWMLTIAAACCDGFSCSAFALRTTIGPDSRADGAAVFAARVNGAGEQPGRERPHLRAPDHDPRVGSGVAHVPAAGDGNDTELKISGDTANDSCREMRNTIRFGSAIDIIRHCR